MRVSVSMTFHNDSIPALDLPQHFFIISGVKCVLMSCQHHLRCTASNPPLLPVFSWHIVDIITT
jgi:hypothetical protein